MTRHSWSLAARLTTWYILTSFALVLFITGLLYWALTANLNRGKDLFLADKVHVLRAILQDRPGDMAGLREEVILESAARRYEQFYVRLLDGQRKPVLTTPGMDALLPPRLFSAIVTSNREPSRGQEIRTWDGRSFWALAASAPVGSSEKTWLIQVAVDRGHDELLLRGYRTWLWLALATTALVCPIAAYRIAHRGIRPIQEIAETAKHTGSARLDARIDPAGYPVELAVLAETLNAMLDRLQDSFSRLSRFSADIAHELRTPINNIRGQAEVVLTRARSIEEYRETVTSSLEESVRLSELIESLLFLARADTPGMQLKREEVDVSAELAAVCEYYEAAAQEAEIGLLVSSTKPITASLDRNLFQQAVMNLVANSIAHTPPGGSITLTSHRDRNQVCVEVSDTGAGIPPADLPHVFDRLYRVDRARSNSGHVGLGLAIVRGIAAVHGGSVEISSELGKGTRVALTFPCDHDRDPRIIRA